LLSILQAGGGGPDRRVVVLPRLVEEVLLLKAELDVVPVLEAGLGARDPVVVDRGGPADRPAVRVVVDVVVDEVTAGTSTFKDFGPG
jgi:hypothetical protein